MKKVRGNIILKRVKRMVFHPQGLSRELDEDIREMQQPDLRRRQIYMSPDEFLRSTYFQYGLTDPSISRIGFKTYQDSFIRDTRGRRDTSESLRQKIRNKDILIDAPYLYLDKGIPINHEGRHRALAAKEEHMNRIPVIIVYKPRDEKSSEVMGFKDIERNVRQTRWGQRLQRARTR
jgi:hypothetical protein